MLWHTKSLKEVKLMDKNKKKNRKYLLSILLILLCIGAAGITGYAVYTRMPILGHTVNTSKDKKGNTKTDSTNEYINPKNIISSESITHKQESSDDDEFIFEDEYENDDSIYSNTDTIDFESEPVTVTTDTSQDTTSQPSIPAPPNKPTNNPPIPLPAPDVPAVNPKPNKPAVPPTDNKHTDDDTSSSARHGHKKPSIRGVTLDKTEITLNKGDISSPLITTISPSNAEGDKTITWKSENESIATVDKGGHITAVGAGTANIVATTSNDKTAECKVTVSVPPSGIKINSDNFAIDKGLSKTLTATVEPADCTDKSVIWATSNNDVISVDDNGKVTAVTPGTATITATTADGKFSSSCEVTVVISISKLELNKTKTTLIKGTEETLTATVTPPDTTEDKKIRWISSNPEIATVDENGKISAVNGGTATITAQVGSHVAECEVTVIVPVSGVEINKSELRLAKDTEETLTANILPEDATDKVVEWTSSNPDIAAVDENGKVTGVNVGTAKITVKTHDGEFTAECTVNVVIPVTGIKLDKTELSIIRKDTAVLIPTITPDNATDKSVIWSSSNENICTVDENGKVTGTGVGTAVITAKSHDGGFTAECKVTVTPDEYTITANAENGKVVGAGTHHVGTDVTLNAVPDEHYHFVNWTYDGKEISTESEYLIKNLNEDISITANFEIDCHIVTVKAGDGGTVSGGGKFAYGTEIKLTATPNDKYEFVKWSDGNTSENRNYKVTGDTTLTALFKLQPYTWTYNIDGGGMYVISMGNDNANTSYIRALPCYDYTACNATYIFTEPLILPAGSTIKIRAGVFSDSTTADGRCELKLNQKEVWSSYDMDIYDDMTNDIYKITSTIEVSTITATSHTRDRFGYHGEYATARIYVTINPLNGDSFLLDNSCTSDK